MTKDVRLTHQTLKVLRVFMANPKDGVAGADIARSTKLMSGTLYPILSRLEKAGCLASEWENVDAKEVGRPRRRLYKITGEGQNLALAAFAELGATDGDFSWA
jgi:PadR family transcriptional regulator, regulatory protein PadR